MFEFPNPSRINYGTSASHATVQAELSGRTAFNDGSVLSQIKIDDVDSRFVQECAKTLKESLEEDIRAFRQLVEAAEQGDPTFLEYEVLHDLGCPDPLDVRPEDRRSHRLELIHHRLSSILKHIQNAPQPDGVAKSRDLNRCFSHQMPQNDSGIPKQHYFLGFPHFYPDFTLTHTTQLRNPQINAGTCGWHDRDGFVLIRPSSLQHPYPTTEDGLARPILTHAANCARIHLSARPFLLFSVCLLVFGGDFCVCIFDRAGARVSPKLNMWCDLETFIRVVRSMTHHLSDVDMGHDPSVALAPASLWSSVDQPAWIINSVDPDTRRWCTVGVPIWSSLSLFGRGTFVWYVREVHVVTEELRGPVMILKSAWRESGRDAESHIYEAVKGSHPGLAKYVVGADVVTSPGGTEKITTHYLRQRSPAPDETTKVLHRIVLGSVGRPIWEYDTDEQLIDGLLSAVEAHKFLWDQKILHHDISAGNVLLSDHPEELGAAGFITDLDLALIEPSDAELKTTAMAEAMSEYDRHPQTLPRPTARDRTQFGTRRGDTITGTWQFMSRRLLRSMYMRDTSDVVTTEADDVESFFWVLLYAVLRKMVAVQMGSDADKTTLAREFRRGFGEASVADILASRITASFYDAIAGRDVYFQAVSYPVRRLLYTYRLILFGTIPTPERPGSSDVLGRPKGIFLDSIPQNPWKQGHDRLFSHEGMIGALKETILHIREVKVTASAREEALNTERGTQ
ncbi:hypothetical protein C8Q79DRAFT_1077266 [Trametes meyenii]|nr:hypothetical protein C8Q79DRAFT_1077266 [Trametes meyenii]